MNILTIHIVTEEKHLYATKTFAVLTAGILFLLFIIILIFRMATFFGFRMTGFFFRFLAGNHFPYGDIKMRTTYSQRLYKNRKGQYDS